MPEEFLNEKPVAALADLDLDADALWGELDINSSPESCQIFLRTLCGKLGINPIGAYDEETEYKIGDCAWYLSAFYRCKAVSTGNLPTNTSFWTLVFAAPEKGQTSTTYAAGDDSRIIDAAQKSSNLSDLANAETARTNLGLGTMATQAASAFMPIYQTAKTVYLDATYGNDSTGTKGHPELPFATLAKAASVASAGDTIVWYPGNYTISATDVSTYGQPNIKSGQTWLCLGPVLTQTVPDMTIFTSGSLGDVRSDWSFQGNLRIKGNGWSTPGSWSSCAFNLSYCQRFDMSGITIGSDIADANANSRGYTGFGIYSAASRGGRFSRINIRHALTGSQFIAGSEYHSFTDCVWEYCSDGLIVAGGNNRFANCHANFNTNGVTLNPGSNHGHGSWVGGGINHNTAKSIYANGVTLGYTFLGVHLYADSTTTNIINIHNSQMIDINGGILSSPMTLSGTLPGKNFLRNMMVFAGNLVLVDAGTQVGQLVYDGNYTLSGTWSGY